tara:strand:- start:1680 stop:2069 length:390 start_codon:yes stop_codon:yes gene_type:complete
MKRRKMINVDNEEHVYYEDETTEDIIEMIKERDIDGATMQYILERTGLDYQMYKQLNVEYNDDSNEMIHRLEMIEDDVNTLLKHLRDGNMLSDKTKYADDGYTHINNIHIALDIQDDECLTWSKFNNTK